MKRKSRIAISCFITALILGMIVTYAISTSLAASEVTIKAIADVSELGDPVSMPDVINSTFSVAIYVEDTVPATDMDLYGFDIQFNWTTQWIHYTSYKVTQPVEDYPGVQSPSPYAGILHEDTMKLKGTVNEADSITSAEPGTMAWFAYSSVTPAPSFNGSGTICVFAFKVIDQPYDYEGAQTIKIHFLKTDLSNTLPSPIAHTAVDLDITLYPRKLEYPPSPMLKVTPDFVTGYYINETFSLNVTLLGADGDDLSSFWDVAGMEFYLNFNTTMIEAMDVRIDPDGAFGAFWEEGIFELAKDIDNTGGWVHVAFMGLGATHDPVNGTVLVATIDFNVTYESAMGPAEPIDLENPLVRQIWYVLNAEGGVIDLSTPVTTQWLAVFPYSRYDLGFNLTDWEDVDGNGELSVGDQIILLNKDTLKWRDYYVSRIAGTIQLSMQPFPATDDYVWATDSWNGQDAMDYCGLSGRTTASFYGDYDGYGHGDWTGNFTLDYPWTSITSITAHYVANGTERVLTPGVDYEAHVGDQLVELLKSVDVHVLNEHWVDGVNNTLNGWPAIGYTATSIQSVYVDMHNETKRYAYNYGFEEGPPSEWWYEPDYPCELESLWATGYYPGPYNWPDGSEWWINYTAVSYLTIDYNAQPDSRPYYLEFKGDYEDFLVLGDPINSSWHEVYPGYCNTWNLTAFDDTDSSEDLTVGDMVTLNNTDGLIRDFQVDALSTDIEVIQKPCVQDVNTAGKYYCDPVIVDIAGFPHPERDMSPWFGADHPVRLPNAVENSAFQAIPEFNGLFVLMSLMLATVAIVVTRKLRNKK